MNVSPEATRVAFITFSETTHVQFTFENYTNKYDVMHAIDLVDYLGHGTRLAPALDLARTMTLTQGRSFYEGFFHYFIVITDDLPSDLDASIKVSIDSVITNQIYVYHYSQFYIDLGSFQILNMRCRQLN